MKSSLVCASLLATLAGPALAQQAVDEEMRDMTSNVLAGITGAAPAAPATDGSEALGLLVQQALSEGQSDAYVASLIQEAAGRGEIEVPDAMRTIEGEIDTASLLSTLVEKSEETSASDEVVAALQDEADTGSGPRYHVVENGESLASIARQYYGQALAYDRIFEANQDELESADLIQPGQRLRIP